VYHFKVDNMELFSMPFQLITDLSWWRQRS